MTKKEAELDRLKRLKDKGMINPEKYEESAKIYQNLTTANFIQNYSHNMSNLQTRVMNTYQPMYQTPTTYYTYSPYSYYSQSYYQLNGQPNYSGYYNYNYNYNSGYGGYPYAYQYPYVQNDGQQPEVQRQTSQVVPVQFYNTQPAQYQTNNWQYQTQGMQ